MSAVTGIGVENDACCQPLALSPLNVAVPRRLPVLVHSEPTWVPVF